mgnify:CR=1 FL=1
MESNMLNKLMFSQIKNALCVAFAILLTACGSDSKAPDADGDSIADANDNCKQTANQEQTDTDGDGKGDACDLAIYNPDLTHVELDRLVETGRIPTIFEGSGRADRLGLDNTFENVGDINGDGIDDLAVIYTGEGSYSSETSRFWTGTMHVHLIAGGTELPALVNKDNVADLAMTTIEVADFRSTENRDQDESYEAAIRVMAGGDFNNDGLQDLVVLDANTRPGILYYIYGRQSWPESIAQSDLPGNYGFSITSVSSVADRHRKIKPAGDINGDGMQDIFIGFDKRARHALNDSDTENPYREIYPYILFGNTTGLFGELDFDALIDGGNGTRFIDSTNVNDGIFGTGISGLGQSMVALGNFNGDQYDDFAILDGSYVGEGIVGDYLYIVYGKESWAAETNLADLTLDDGFILSGIYDLDNWLFRRLSEASIASNEDFNGDGLSDVFINTAYYRDSLEGEIQYGVNIVLWGGEAPTKLNTNILYDKEDLQYYAPDGRNRKWAMPAFLPNLTGNNTAELLLGVPNYDSAYTNSDDELDYGNFGRGGVYVVYGKAPFYDGFDFTALQSEQGYFIYNSNGNTETANEYQYGDGFGRDVGSLGGWSGQGSQYAYFGMPYYDDTDTSDQYSKGRVYIMPLTGSLYGDE